MPIPPRLRDNMAMYKEQQVLRGLKYAIIDEVDSILIDEARTPLIISGQSGKSTKLYELCDVLVRRLERGEFKGEMTKIKEAVEKMFDGVKVASVNTLNLDGKKKRRGYKFGVTPNKKKAIVKLTADSKDIELFENL